MRKLLLIIILLSLFFTLNSFAQTRLSGGQAYGWYVIDPPSIPGIVDFSDLYFTDDNTGWLTTSTYDSIYRTDDGAFTFSTQTTPLGYTSAIHMLDEDNGYSGGAGGWVYITTNGGLNWDFIGSMGNLLDISFPFGTTPANPIGYASGNSGNVWEITSTLTNLNSPSSSTLSGISAPSVNNVWVCGGNRIYYYDGNSFTSQIAPAGAFNDIHFINNLEGWVVGDAGVIGHTTNGGTLWITQTNPDTQNRSLYGVFFLDINNGWAVGSDGVVLHKADGGTTWTVEGAGLTSAFLRGVHFTSITNGYVVGNDKTLIKFGELTSVENEEELPTEFLLSQNYPNPFNPTTKMKFSTPQNERRETQDVSLRVYDVLGNEIETLVNEEKPMGTYEITWYAESLPSGVYFYQLKVDSFIETKKMILMK